MVSRVGKVALGSRVANLDRLARELFDLVVIGGGITGAGVALDAASRGIKVALVERDDFACGTSSRSSKLIHGGLRYVAQYQFRVTRESSAERYRLLRLAPHLVRSVPFILPVYGGVRETVKLTAGLWLYDVLAALRNSHLHKHVTALAVHELVPALTTVGLDGGFVYYDCRTDDARLTIEVLKTAASYGAVAANHARVERLLDASGRIAGVGVTDELDGTSFEIRARCVVAAMGVWLDTLRPPSGPRAAPIVRPAKGVHLVLPEPRLGNGDSALTLQTARDRRITFVIPWMHRTIAGTTDTDYDGDLARPRATREDVGYLLEALARAFPGQQLTEDDVISVQAGLRPLVNDPKASTAAISREDQVIESESGLISIAGGKLTTYRRTARKVVDLVARRLAEQNVRDVGPCRTGGIPIGGEGDDGRAEHEGADLDGATHLAHLYGAQARDVMALAASHPALGARLVSDLPHIAAEVVHATRNEMALTLSDVLIRRLRLAPADVSLGMSCLDVVADLMRHERDWSPEERERQIEWYRRDVEQFAVPGRALAAATRVLA